VNRYERHRKEPSVRMRLLELMDEGCVYTSNFIADELELDREAVSNFLSNLQSCLYVKGERRPGKKGLLWSITPTGITRLKWMQSNLQQGREATANAARRRELASMRGKEMTGVCIDEVHLHRAPKADRDAAADGTHYQGGLA
jgi:predicted transcriptional regulator